MAAYTIPTESPEADGTLEWSETTLVTVHAGSGDVTGFGYSYASVAAASFIEDTLARHVLGNPLDAPRQAFNTMVLQARNAGRPGIASCAISAVDVALYDLKARTLNIPLLGLLGPVRTSIVVYGSGGFTSYTERELRDQMSDWQEHGISAVKMKIGSDPSVDRKRVAAARQAIGSGTGLYVDANGAYDRKQALHFADAFADCGVTWFEEPVSSDDLEGLHLLRDRAPAGMDIAAGEYGYDQHYFRRMLEAQAVDVLQIDGTRCGGVTGFLDAAALAQPFDVPISAHTAPTLHGHICCAASRARNVEYFFDHVRIERMLFDGVLTAEDGRLEPDLGAPGLGVVFKSKDAQKYQVYSGHLRRSSPSETGRSS